MFRNCDKKSTVTWVWRVFSCFLAILPILLIPLVAKNVLRYTTSQIYGQADCKVVQTDLAPISCSGEPCGGPESAAPCDCWSPEWSVVFTQSSIIRKGVIYGAKSSDPVAGGQHAATKRPQEVYGCYYLKTDFTQLAWAEDIEPQWPNFWGYWHWKNLFLILMFTLAVTLCCFAIPYFRKSSHKSKRDISLLPVKTFRVGEWVEVYSATEMSWNMAEVIEVLPNHVVVAYENRRKLLRNTSPSIRKIVSGTDQRLRSQSFAENAYRKRSMDIAYRKSSMNYSDNRYSPLYSSDIANRQPFPDPLGPHDPYLEPTPFPHEQPEIRRYETGKSYRVYE